MDRNGYLKSKWAINGSSYEIEIGENLRMNSD